MIFPPAYSYDPPEPEDWEADCECPKGQQARECVVHGDPEFFDGTDVRNTREHPADYGRDAENEDDFSC